ncbi:periplasmic heavy metal sensor [Trinickia caryophylli]|nr:hypothetical protein C0Z17_04625 [Trinickia caryophylli]TRX15478.1 periplasmic heavy metal sensor [Trinickia caryophylli]
MMGGAGWYGMGPSMMGGGRGMMRGRGYGTGMMMGAPGWAGALQLSDDQRAKVNRIADETRKAHWTLMGEMMDRQAKLRDLYEAPKRDDAAIDAAFKDIAAVRQKMFDTSADARKRMDAVLTDKQREQLRSYERDADAFGW